MWHGGFQVVEVNVLGSFSGWGVALGGWEGWSGRGRGWILGDLVRGNVAWWVPGGRGECVGFLLRLGSSAGRLGRLVRARERVDFRRSCKRECGMVGSRW